MSHVYPVFGCDAVKKAMGKNKKANDSDLQYILNFINGR